MSVAYIDTSVSLAIEFDEAKSDAVESKLGEFLSIVTSKLSEAEYRSACARRFHPYSRILLSKIDWVFPHRRLTDELTTVLDAGYLRGADLWHVAMALYVSKQILSEVAFITLDAKQLTVAHAVGFPVWPE